ncbi:MAG: hypothetical protein IKW59_04960, partial [Clostridia bacterium]|nr:hypothetical protein [Clostridia bacterium]
MKKTFKSLLHIMLALLMVLSTCGIVFADGTAKIDVSIVDASDDIDTGVNKLVFKVTTPAGDAGVNATGIVFSYDTAV